MISPPTVEIPTGDLFMYTKGENILIDCKVTASSKTNVHWEFKGAEVGIRKDIYSKETIPFSVPAADKTWEGQYTCVAENEAGKVQKQAESVYVELPLVKAATPYMAVKLNEDATLKCIVSGIPPPVVSWVFGDKLIANGSKYQISTDGSSLKILKADLKDEGTYKCVARGPRDSESTAEAKFRIGRPPTAKHLFLNNSIDLDHDGTFPCESDYNPEDALYPGMKTKISWKREGGPLDGRRQKSLTSGELKIKAAEVTDEGLYICTLQNAFGETNMRMNLEVNGTDVPFVKMISLDEFVIGKELKITCEVESLIPFTLQWYKDGHPIGAKKEFQKSSGDSIIMPNAKKEDRGHNKCEATNKRGSDSKDTVVNFIALPQINGMDEGRLIVAEGGPITLKCTVTSDSPYDVQWLRKKGVKEGTLLSPSDAVRIQKDSLSIPSLSDSEVGKYVCRAFNKAGITEKEVEISMIALPIVEIPTGDRFMFSKGENILIGCKVTASSKTSVHWEFKGAEVSLRRDIYAKETIPFSVSAADKTWEGQYTCVAENKAGKVQKQVESIYMELPLVKAATPYMAVKLDEDATLNCIVSGIPPPVVSWVFGDRLIANGHKYQISPDGSSLKILKADLKDEGTYKCVARGPRDSERTAETKFRIGRPPAAKHIYLNNSIDLEHDGTFPCESDYNPENALYPGMKTKISWQREGGPLDVSRHRELTSGELKIEGAEVTDKGLYICTLQNAFGKTSMRLNLEVKGIVPPILEDVKPEYVEFKQGATIVLWCNASGVPEPKIIWSYKNHHTSPPEALEDGLDDPGSIKVKGGKLTIYYAISAYEGIFSCVADNGADTTSPKDYILRMLVGHPVLADDGKPTKAKVKAGDDYTFNCNTNSEKHFSYKWIKGDKHLIARNIPGYFTFNKDHSSLTLHSTVPGYHSGYYECIVSNGVGTASKIFYISVEKP